MIRFVFMATITLYQMFITWVCFYVSPLPSWILVLTIFSQNKVIDCIKDVYHLVCASVSIGTHLRGTTH